MYYFIEFSIKALRNEHYKCIHIVDKETNLEQIACNHTGSNLHC